MTPTYLLTSDPVWIVVGFLVQSMFAGAMYSQMPSYLTERFPTEVRATASGFCFHQAAIFGGSVAPVLTYFAIDYQLGFAIPMLIGTTFGLVSVIVALLSARRPRGTSSRRTLLSSPDDGDRSWRRGNRRQLRPLDPPHCGVSQL